MPVLSPAAIHRLTSAIFEQAGAPSDLAAQVADILVANHLAGHDSHGILRIPEYVDSVRKGEIVPTARPEILNESPTTALISGNWCFGQVLGLFAMDLAIAKAKEHRVAAVACVQAGHTGRIGAFTERAAREGVVAFMAIGTVGKPMTAPYGGARPILGTNPVSFAVPADRHPPVLLDYATSAIAAGKVKVAKARGQQLPPGSILDSNGQPSTNPDDLFHGGFLLPFGAHKGYALAVIAELLSGPLVGAETFPAVFQRSGVFIFCMDAGAFRPAEAAAAAVDASIDKIKAVPPGPGFDEVLVPGEVEARSQQQRERDGIPIPDLTWQAVGEVAASLGLNLETIARG